MPEQTNERGYDPNQMLSPELEFNGSPIDSVATPVKLETSPNADGTPFQDGRPLPRKPGVAILEVPIFDGVIHGYCSNHVDMRLSPDQAELLRRISLGLDAANARHPDGRPVNTQLLGEPLRWILGQLAAELAQQQDAPAA